MSGLTTMRLRGWLSGGLSLMVAASSLLAPAAQVAHAATGEVYMLQATDPHGNVWLPGTVDGATTGRLYDPNLDPPDSPAAGHLWTADVTSGFCRVIPTNPKTGVPAFLDRATPGGCITAGQKPGQPALDPRRNPDGTLYVYTPDWATGSLGAYRLTYDPGKQVMLKAEVLAPNRFPAGIKPFDVALGPADHKLYVSNDRDGSITRISDPSTPTAQQTVEPVVATSSNGLRVRALEFACWSNLDSLNGGRGAQRAPGAPGCSAADPAPDLVLAQKSSVTVILNAETCQTSATGCVVQATPISALSPMGVRVDPSNPSVLYVSDSPGATSQIVRYNITTNVQDSYANYGVLDNGSLSQLAFVFSVGFGPDHAMYIGDDPSAGATAFNGRIFRIAPRAPADAVGQPNVAAIPPPPPSLKTGELLGGGITLASDGVWMGSHYWVADSLNGLCRMDGAPGSMTENNATCTTGPIKKVEQSAFDAGKNLLYVADSGTGSVGVVRFTFDPSSETLSDPQILAPSLLGTTLGLDGQRADAVALDPATDTLYVGFQARNQAGGGQGGLSNQATLGGTTQIARLRNASAADTTTQSVEFVARTTDNVPVFGLALVKGDLYVGDNRGLEVLRNVATCATGECTAMLLLNVRAPKGLATDGVDHLYLAGPSEVVGVPTAGVALGNTPVQQYTISTGQLLAYSSGAVDQAYGFVFSLGLDPDGNLYVSDYPSAVAPPNALGHLYKVSAAQPAVPSQPSVTVRPGNPTNVTSPVFGFGSASSNVAFSCSLSAGGDAFSTCSSGQTFGPLADGNYTFKVVAIDQASLSVSQPAVYAFTVDTVPPVVSVSASASGFTLSANKAGVGFACSLSAGADAFVACPAFVPVPASLAPGTYTFQAFGVDPAGNASQIQSVQVTVSPTNALTFTALPASAASAPVATLLPGGTGLGAGTAGTGGAATGTGLGAGTAGAGTPVGTGTTGAGAPVGTGTTAAGTAAGTGTNGVGIPVGTGTTGAGTAAGTGTSGVGTGLGTGTTPIGTGSGTSTGTITGTVPGGTDLAGGAARGGTDVGGVPGGTDIGGLAGGNLGRGGGTDIGGGVGGLAPGGTEIGGTRIGGDGARATGLGGDGARVARGEGGIGGEGARGGGGEGGRDGGGGDLGSGGGGSRGR